MKERLRRWTGRVMVPALMAAMVLPVLSGLVLDTKVSAAGGMKITSSVFPDNKFFQYIKNNFDVNPSDMFLSEAEIAAATSMDCRDLGIERLIGIKYFTSLSYLNCSGNQLTELDLQYNDKLKYLYCYDNKLEKLKLNPDSDFRQILCENNQLDYLDIHTYGNLYELNCADNQLRELDIQNNPKLETLQCQGNEIPSLAVEKCPDLKTCNCADNWIRSLDLSKNTKLISLNCSMNRLSELDVKKCTNLCYLYFHTNGITDTPDLSACTKLVEVDCKSNYLTSQPAVPSGCALTYSPQKVISDTSIPVDKTHFPDEAFRQIITLKYDTDPCDGYLSAQEIAAVTDISCNRCNIRSLEGIEYFSSLKVLNCMVNDLLSLDVSSNKNLLQVTCQKNKNLAELKIRGLEKLDYVDCSECALTELDTSGDIKLKTLYAFDNKLTELDVSANSKLEYLSVRNNHITSLDLSQNTLLKDLYCSYNDMALLDVSSCAYLTKLDCSYNYIEQVTGVPSSCKVTREPQKTVGAVTGFSGMATSDTEIELKWDKVEPASGYLLYYTYKNGSYSYKTVTLTQTEATVTDLSEDTDYYYQVRAFLDIGTERRYGELSEVLTVTTPIKVDAKHFPDEDFLFYISFRDSDDDGFLTRKERDAVTSIKIEDYNVADLTGIGYFTKLQELYCAGNHLTSLDLSKNTELLKFDCSKNPDLKSLDLRNNKKLHILECDGCNLSALDVSQNRDLWGLSCENNQLTELDLKRNTGLQTLCCASNKLTSLDLSNNDDLDYIRVFGNQIEELDIHYCTFLAEELGYCDLYEEVLIDSLGQEYEGYGIGAEAGRVEYDKTMRLILKERAKCTVTFDANGGSGSVKALTVLEGDSITLPSNGFTAPDGKVFDKWSAGKPGDSVVVNADMTVKAIWKDAPVTPKPTGVTPKPTGATPKPTGATPKPTGATPKPTGVTPKPTGATPKPTGATPKPTGATPKPTGATPKPTGVTPKPTGATPNPTGVTPKPTGVTPKPTGATPKPTGATPKPTGVTPKPDDPTPTPDPEKEPSIADFVERLYTIALARESEPEGKAFWVNEIESGNRTGGDCAHFFLIEAQEFLNRGLTDEDFVEILYLTFFDRASEPAGKKFWVDSLKNGTMTKENVINGFIDSTEWCNVCATYGVKSGAPNAKAEFASKNAIKFATRLYTCCLGRDPEEGGLKYWSLALTNLEQTGYAAAEQFFTGEEFVNLKTTDEEYVKRLYTTFMGREPEPSEITFWTGELAKGTQTRTSTMQFFGHSEEFTNICKQYGIDRG